MFSDLIEFTVVCLTVLVGLGGCKTLADPSEKSSAVKDRERIHSNARGAVPAIFSENRR